MPSKAKNVMPSLASHAVEPIVLPGYRAWWEYGACRTASLPANSWFPCNDVTDTTDARQTCQACPVRKLCLTEALRIPNTVGIWGGLDEHERARLKEIP